MHILYITPAYHPIIGGAETHVRILAEGMVSLGHYVTVLTDQLHPDSLSVEKLGGVEILRTSHYRSFINQPDKVPWEESLFGLLREFSELLADRKIDIIHAHCQVSALLGAMIKTKLACPLIVSMHETQPELDPMGDGRSKMMYAHLPYDKLIACSQFFYEQAIHYGASSEQTHLVYYSIDLTKFTPDISGQRIRVELGLDNNQILIVLAARFKARKGLLEFVEAMAQVRDTFPEVKALITGSCHSASLDYINLVHSRINELGLQDTVIIKDGVWGLDDMPEVYAAADLVVQPSHAEGLGIAILEAMATAKPVIGTDISGIKEIITHKENGLLVPPKTNTPLAEAIVYLLSNPDEAIRLANNGYSFVHERFSMMRMIEQTYIIYQELSMNIRS